MTVELMTRTLDFYGVTLSTGYISGSPYLRTYIHMYMISYDTYVNAIMILYFN